MKYSKKMVGLLFIPALLGLACDFSAAKTQPNMEATAQAIAIIQTQTVLAAPVISPTAESPTATVTATETQVPSGTPTDINTPTNTLTPTITQTPTSSIPCNSAEYVADLNYEDGTDVEPGKSFTKKWRIRNSGSCNWTSGYSVVYASGEISGPSSVQLTSGTIPPGSTVDVSIQLKAPSDSGTYTNYYMLKSPEGNLFGINSNVTDPFYVEIEVVPTITATPRFVIIPNVKTKADIEVGSLAGCSANVKESCTISFVVTNTGGTTTGDFCDKGVSGIQDCRMYDFCQFGPQKIKELYMQYENGQRLEPIKWRLLPIRPMKLSKVMNQIIPLQ